MRRQRTSMVQIHDIKCREWKGQCRCLRKEHNHWHEEINCLTYEQPLERANFHRSSTRASHDVQDAMTPFASWMALEVVEITSYKIRSPIVSSTPRSLLRDNFRFAPRIDCQSAIAICAVGRSPGSYAVICSIKGRKNSMPSNFCETRVNIN